MNTRAVRILGGVVMLVAMVYLGCNEHDEIGTHSGFVGGPCSGNVDCEDVCLRGGDFPEGTCSLRCRDDGDCPEGTACIDKEDGVCLLLCDQHAQCRGGYKCDDKDRHGHVGKEYVCIN